ncbi:MAG: c-type cytochrome [Bacteroidia bacterium]|nr:c-type cytochrome [Bacteroidia bacterium]
MNPKRKLTFLIASLFLFLSASAQNAAEGEKLFKDNCQSCHAINDKVVGPALKDVHKRKDEAWLIKWVKNSQKVVTSGDAYAVEIFKKYGSVMPAFESLSDGQVKSILAYVKQESEKAPATVTASTGTSAASPANQATNASMKSNINWLLIIVVGLLFVVIFLVFNILETVGRIQGHDVVNWSSINGFLLLAIGLGGVGLSIWEFMAHAPLTVSAQKPASEHGPGIDSMFNITLLFTGVVFIITQVALFYFAWKYRAKKNTKAYFYSHNDKLEYAWTIVPAIVLTILVINGLKNWNKIFSKPAPGTANVEVFAYQFGWTARYPGADNTLGKHDFREIGKSNALGVLTDDPKSADDFTSSEIHLPVNKPVTFKFRAKDVIHSAFLPHFRVQMNVVPGLPTEFTFTPTVTTAEMRTQLNNPKFDYALLCNKICGAAHYRMKVTVVIDSQAEYDKWVAEQKPAFTKSAAVETPAADTQAADAGHTASNKPLASVK